MNATTLIEELKLEAETGSCRNDRLTVIFNDHGYRKYRHQLPEGSNAGIPRYTIGIHSINYATFVTNLKSLFPFIKGLSLNVTVPQRRRKLVTFLNNTILEYLGRCEIDNTHSIISELTANAERANLESVISVNRMGRGISAAELLRTKRPEIVSRAEEMGKEVSIAWKFSNKIYKVEVRNNTIISGYALDAIRSKIGIELNSLAEGYVGEVFDKLGAGLGLYFINFFSEEMKEKYGFETIFRIFTTEANTSATLTVFFVKNSL